MATWRQNYSEISEIGQGTFGEVVKCRPISGDQQGKWVALKIINLSSIQDEAILKRIVKKADVMKKFDYWSSVKLYNYVHDEGNHLLLLEMEYCPDGDLANAITLQKGKQQPFNEDQIREWFSQVALALQNLQEHFHLLHRDIKPSNIFLLNNKSLVKLGDSRISKILTEYRIATGAATLTFGNLQYMSPQALNGDKPSFPDDIWSLGVVLFELATLQLPFIAEATAVSFFKEIEKGKWSCEVNSSEPLKELLQELLESDVTKRPAIGQVVGCEFLRAALDREPELDSGKQKELFEACLMGNIELARSLLLSHQGDVNAKYSKKKHRQIGPSNSWNNGFTCLMFAACNNQPKIVEMLIREFKANVEQLEDEDGCSAIFYAAKWGYIDCIRILCEDGKANAKLKNKKGETTLMWAVERNDFDRHTQTVEYLIKRGVKVNERNDEGKTAMALAHRGLKELLKKYGGTSL